MKIRMTTSMAGVGLSLIPGDEPECFSDAEKQRLVDAGFAIKVDGDAEPKTKKSAAKK